ARLIAMVRADGRLAVNRSRPSAFTLENWRYATAAEGTVGPVRIEDGAALPIAAAVLSGHPSTPAPGEGAGVAFPLAAGLITAPQGDRIAAATGAPRAGGVPTGLASYAETAFRCDDRLCVAR